MSLTSSDGNAGDAGKEVRILFTNNSNGKLADCHCKNDPYGGLAERVSFVDEYRKAHPDVLLLDSGGYFGLTGIDRKGPVILKLMERMNYAACGIGDQELFRGLGTFMEKFGWFAGHIVNVSLHDKAGNRVFQPYLKFDVNGITIAVTGIVSEDTFKFFPEKNRDFTIASPDSIINEMLPELRRQSDYIVVLSQMGIDGDRTFAGSQKSIDLIIGGHSQTLLERPLVSGTTRIVQAGKNAGRVGEIILIFDDRDILDTFSYNLIEITTDYTVGPDIRQLVEDSALRINPE